MLSAQNSEQSSREALPRESEPIASKSAEINIPDEHAEGAN
jgi:hypothetical protein